MWLPSQEYTQINEWARQTEKLDGCTPEFWQLTREAGLTHIYLREGRGGLRPEMLTACPRLQELYHADGVWIYEILLP
jgi:alkylation response protein AidB-like acyl-CoA dehydrogenase